MPSDSSSVVDQVERLRTLIAATVVFYRTPRAQKLWQRFHHAIGPIPDTYVTADDGMSTVEGLVIGGDWDAEEGWDLNGSFTVLADDGVILTVNGWMACEIEVL